MAYIKVPLTDVVEIEKIISVYPITLDKNYVYDGESHDFWELIFVDSGEAHVTSGARDFRMRDGDILFHRPGSFHSVRCNGTVGADIVIFGFDSHSLALEVFGNEKMSVPTELRRYLYTALGEAADCFLLGKMPLTPRRDAPLGAQQLLRSTLEVFLIRLMRAAEGTRNTRRLFTSRVELERQLVGDIINYLGENIGNKLSLDGIAEHFHFGKSYLAHTFKAHTNMTIAATLTSMKIERAKELLRSGEETVGEISDRLAFENPQYFSKVFKRHVGTTPTVYRSEGVLGKSVDK